MIEARWIATVDGQDRVLENQVVAIDQGKIVGIGAREELCQIFKPSSKVSLSDHLLIPGFVNAHTHGAMTLLRGFADDIPLKKWLNDHIWPVESRWMSESFVQSGTDLAMAEMLKGGTTTFNEMYFFPDVVSRSVIRVGMRACVGLTVIEFPTAWAQNANEYIDKGLVVRDQIKGSDLLSVALAPHAPYTVSDDTLSRLVSLAEELDCQIHMHIHETLDELEESQSNYGLRPLERLRRLSALSPRMMAVHMTHLLPEEIQVLAELGVHVIHCPESNLKLASGICSINELHCAGINVALGTDGAASNNDLDMLGREELPLYWQRE